MPRSCRSAALLLLLLPLTLFTPMGAGVRAQEGTGMPLGDPIEPTVHRKDIWCTGFISKKKHTTKFRIIGGEREDEVRYYSPSNIVYLNYGARDGASVGDNLHVLRPHGEFES